MPKIPLFFLAVLLILASPAMASEPSLVLVDENQGIYKSPKPIKCSEYEDLSGDPDVYRDGATYRMYCTGANWYTKSGAISGATSMDGYNWNTLAPAGRDQYTKSLLLLGKNDTWEHQLETADVIKFKNRYYMYYSGYPKIGWPENPGQIGVAVSNDGKDFKRLVNTPVLAADAQYYDGNGLYSPATIIVKDEMGKSALMMVYAGHNYKANKVSPGGIYVLGATSNDGITWKKQAKPLLAPSQNLPFMKEGVAEPDIIYASDGYYYLFFTANLGDDEKRLIAVARSQSPFGPYTVRKTPVLTATDSLFDKTGVLAPSVLIENGKLRMWYLTSDGDKHRTGYAEMPWPIKAW